MKSRHVIAVSAAYPLLDPGTYLAVCNEASFAWARQWKKWIARLAFQLQNYTGKPYQGTLCKFLSLGTNPERPCAGHYSAFRQLYVEANGGQPVSSEVTVCIFEKLPYEITVETVTRDRNGKERKPEHWYSIIREIHVARAVPTSQPANTSLINLSTQRTQSTYLTDQHSNPENTPLAEREKQTRNSAFFRSGASE
jgi:hypothetical protein